MRFQGAISDIVESRTLKARMDQEPSFQGEVMEILNGAVKGKRDRELLGLGDKPVAQAAE